MAKVQSNLVIHGLSGMLGKQVVVRRMKNGQYVLSAAPNNHSQAVTDAQKLQREKFHQAILYAKAAQQVPEYQDIAESRGVSAYNVAVADFLHPPEIQNIDLSSYKGAPGQNITITAVDDVKVKTVREAPSKCPRIRINGSTQRPQRLPRLPSRSSSDTRNSKRGHYCCAHIATFRKPSSHATPFQRIWAAVCRNDRGLL